MSEQKRPVGNWLIQEYGHVIKWIAHKLAPISYGGAVGKEDLYQIGCIALCEAWERYDTSLGQFSSYAIIRVRGSMLDELRKQTLRISPHVRALIAELGDVPGKAEWNREYHGKPVHNSKKRMVYPSYRVMLSCLHTHAASIEEAPELAYHENEPSEFDYTAAQIVRMLPRKYRAVHKMILFGMTQKSISEIFGIAESRISQIYHGGIRWYKAHAHLSESEVLRARDDDDRSGKSAYLIRKRVQRAAHTMLSPRWNTQQ